jgi:hypothetical protein
MTTDVSSNLIRKLDELDAQYEALSRQLVDPNVLADHRQVRALSIRRSAIEPLVEKYRLYRAIQDQIEENRTIVSAGEDRDLAELAREEVSELEARRDEIIDQIQKKLVTADDQTISSIILEVRAGVGGDEAALFAGDLISMYEKFAAEKNWSVEWMQSSPAEIGGYKQAILNIAGEGVWAQLGYEGGTHQVKRVPATEAQGRVHTSTATVAVLPEPEEVEVELDPNDVHTPAGDPWQFKVYNKRGVPESGIALHVRTVSGSKPQKIARVAPDGIVGCEVATWTSELWWRVIARLGEKRGWLWASGSFESSTDWLSAVWKDWQFAEDSRSYDIPSWTNSMVYPGGRQDPEIVALQDKLPEHLFSERIAGRPAPPQGTVYAEASRKQHVRDVEYDPALPVEVAIDPGTAGAYAVLAMQVVGNEIRVVDELYERGFTHDDAIREVRKRPWGAKLSTGVIDGWGGTQHHGHKSALEVWREHGVKLRPRRVKPVDGIIRTKTFLRSDGRHMHTLVVSPKAKGLLSEWGLGASVFPGTGPWLYKLDAEGNPLREMPEQRNNHASTALYFWLVDQFGYVHKSRKRKDAIEEEDIEEALNTTEMAKRQFREIARVAGLVFPGYPGQGRTTRQLQMSSGLIFDVFRNHDPENRLLAQAYREVLEQQLEIGRLRAALERIHHGQLLVVDTPRPTPLAFPILVERMRESVSSQKLADRIRDLQLRLERTAP